MDAIYLAAIVLMWAALVGMVLGCGRLGVRKRAGFSWPPPSCRPFVYLVYALPKAEQC